MKNNIDLFSDVRSHYEAYPYPSYPFWFGGKWSDSASVDLSKWQSERPVKEAWIAGCGTVAPLMFARRNANTRFLASDLSARSLKILRARLVLSGLHNVELRCEDLCESAFVERFDVIDAYGVIHHTSYPAQSLSTLARALRVGGVLRIMLYSKEARQAYEKLRLEVRENQKALLSFKDLKKIAIRSGLEGSKDIQSFSGLADAFLHPLVHVYDEQDLKNLLASNADLEVIRRDSSGNHIVFLRKRT